LGPSLTICFTEQTWELGECRYGNKSWVVWNYTFNLKKQRKLPFYHLTHVEREFQRFIFNWTSTLRRKLKFTNLSHTICVAGAISGQGCPTLSANSSSLMIVKHYFFTNKSFLTWNRYLIFEFSRNTNLFNIRFEIWELDKLFSQMIHRNVHSCRNIACPFWILSLYQ
jgi:hypothetical protein